MRKDRFTFLCNQEERSLLAALAERLQRSQCDAVRLLIREAARELSADGETQSNEYKIIRRTYRNLRRLSTFMLLCTLLDRHLDLKGYILTMSVEQIIFIALLALVLGYWLAVHEAEARYSRIRSLTRSHTTNGWNRVKFSKTRKRHLAVR